MKSDPLAVVELAYDVDSSESDWLERLSQAVHGQLGAGMGAQSFTYESSRPPEFRTSPCTRAALRTPPGPTTRFGTCVADVAFAVR